MKRSEVTYGQLDKVLRSLGFTCRLEPDPPTRVYRHPETGAGFFLPAFPESERVLEVHMVAVRGALGNFGIADPKAFAAKLQKAD
jgi:hypothetical protein